MKFIPDFSLLVKFTSQSLFTPDLDRLFVAVLNQMMQAFQFCMLFALLIAC